MVYEIDEKLKAKYGRNNNLEEKEQIQKDLQQTDNLNPDKFEKTDSGKKNDSDLNRQESGNINIKIEQESAENLIEQEIMGGKRNKKKIIKPETPLVKFLKIIVYLAIIGTLSSILIAFFVRSDVNAESEAIIEQIKKSEDIYFEATGRYSYFSKTNYSETLGINLSKRKYFVSYEVVPNKEFGNYEIKLYGATNAFTITYYVIKNFIVNKE